MLPLTSSVSLQHDILKIAFNHKLIIGKIYNKLLQHNSTTLNHLKAEWEEDLKIKISEQDWLKITLLLTSKLCMVYTGKKINLRDLDPTCERCNKLLMPFSICSGDPQCFISFGSQLGTGSQIGFLNPGCGGGGGRPI